MTRDGLAADLDASVDVDVLPDLVRSPHVAPGIIYNAQGEPVAVMDPVTRARTPLARPAPRKPRGKAKRNGGT